MDSKTSRRIIAALRKLTYSHAPRTCAKRRAKVAPATYRCEHCGLVVYEGSKSLEKADLSQFERVVKGKTHMDHKEPVVDPEKGFETWDIYIKRMFCDEDGWQVLCEECHSIKTQLEKELKKNRKNR